MAIRRHNSLPYAKHSPFGLWLSGFMLFLAIFSPFAVSADDKDPVFEEISVSLKVLNVGGTEVEALIRDEEVYLSVTDLFNFLKIKNQPSSGFDQVSGFFLTQNNSYIIDKGRKQIVLGNQTYPLGSDALVGTAMGLFLKADVFGKVFGLNCSFHFRSLTVTLKTNLELPVFREKRQAQLRQNLSQLKKEITADTILNQNNRASNIGALDWSITSTQSAMGLENTRLNFNMGTLLAGGETNISLNYASGAEFDLRRQNYRWRYVFTENKALTQITAGKIATQSTASLFAPVIGLQFTNAATTLRRSFGSYNLTDQTEPGWQVELYLNNILINYTQADASGFFTFKVPMVYGNTVVKLKFLGPWGEERIKEQKINIPYSFLPRNEVEYTVSAGMLEDGKHSRFTRAEVKYGINRRLTAGSGIEYFSALKTGNILPFMNASLSITSGMFLTADYVHGVRSRAILNYRPPGDIQFEVNYTRYRPGQKVIYYNFLEERKASISKPFRGKRFSGFSRLTFNQIIYPSAKQTVADLMLSGNMKNVSTNLGTYARITGADYVNVYSNLTFSFRLPKRYTLRPQIQYGYAAQQVNYAKVELEKPLFRSGFLNLSYENNFNYGTSGFGIGLRLDLSVARASLSARQSGNRTVFTQSIQGGSVFDVRTGYAKLNNRSNVGKGGLIILPFLDINGNNRRDAGEPKVQGLKARISGGRVENDPKDSVFRVFDLKPYDKVVLDVSASSFDNIAWQLKNKLYQVRIEPNRLKLVEVPVKVFAEASGMVYGNNDDSTGQGRVIINFFRNGKFQGKTISESDGYFSYMGLTPGPYTACIDSSQLRKINLSATPHTIPFTVTSSLEGDVISGLDFKLQPAEPEKQSVNPVRMLLVATDQMKPMAKELPQIAFRPKSFRTGKSINGSYAIHARAFGSQNQAAVIKNKLEVVFERPVKIFFEGTNYFKLQLSGLESRIEAEQAQAILSQYGIKNVNILINKPKTTVTTSPKTESPGIPATHGNIRYAILVGKGETAKSLEPLKLIINKTLGVPAYETMREQYYRLVISGLKTQNEAQLALEKLNSKGITGSIISYKEVPVRLH